MCTYSSSQNQEVYNQNRVDEHEWYWENMLAGSHHLSSAPEPRGTVVVRDILLMSVRTLETNCTRRAFMLASSRGAPKPGSAAVEVQPMRARKRSSERMAIALMRRTDTSVY